MPVLVVGEVLWDSLPSGLFLGGAPHNVACHLHQLGTEVALASCVGDDVLGREATRRIAARGIDTGLVQVHPDLPTGFVHVEVDADGIPEYDIVQPAAWDAIATTDALAAAAGRARAVLYGTLAQRSEASRQTLRALWEAAAFRVCDVNLRPPFLSREVVEASIRGADLVKLNGQEVATLAEWFGLETGTGPAGVRRAMRSLTEALSVGSVCVTMGPLGALLLHEGEVHEHAGYRVVVEDTVGAGDAFLAALLASLLGGASAPEALERANRLGAFVAGARGAIPPYAPAEVFASPPAGG